MAPPRSAQPQPFSPPIPARSRSRASIDPPAAPTVTAAALPLRSGLVRRVQRHAGLLGSKRTNSIAIAAVAVLGAMTTGAIVLPAQAEAAAGTGTSRATADRMRCAAPSRTAPVPSRTSIASPRTRQALQSAGQPRASVVAASTSVAPSSAETPSASASASPSATSASARSTATAAAAATGSASAPTSAAPEKPAWAPDGVVRALRTILAGAPAGRTTTLGAGTFDFSDFTSTLIGIDLGGSGSLKGAGSGSTTVAMTAHTSSKAGSVPSADWTTNQLYLMSVTGASPTLSGFTLRGTAQGHMYNGLRIGQATNARVNDVTVTGIPGNDDIPPGETFGINDWRTSGSVYSNIEVDGSGRVGASGFATNSSTNVTVNHGDFHDMRANGTAFWQTSGVTLNDVSVKYNVTGLNFERTTGSIVVNRPVFSGNNQDVYLASDQGGGTLVITDPTFGDTYSGHKINIQVPKTYRGVANHFTRSSVKVVIGGVDRTADVVHWVGNS